ncbi:MAG: leucyl aminopeptidase family protein [Runella sp.]
MLTIKVHNTPTDNTAAFLYFYEEHENLTTHLKIFETVPWLTEEFKAEAKQVQFFYIDSKKHYFIGLGKNPTQADFIKTLRSFFYKHKKTLPDNVAIDLTRSNVSNEWVEAIVNGCVLGDYDLGLYKTEKPTEPHFFQKESLLQIIIAQEDTPFTTEAAQRGEAIAQTQIRVMDLMNAPSNKKTPQTLADWAIASGKKWGYEVKVFDEKMINDIGLHALEAVSRGSKSPPRLIVAEYKHADATQKIGLVGKGVTFDTGGVSLKQSANMHLMKSDMGGAGAVLGTIEAAAKLMLPVHLIAIVPATENSIDGQALKPGDVIESYAGKTIEVIDTDAEGRLILADGLSYLIRNYQPDILIDLATLTGSCVATLGYVAAGMFTQNDTLAQSLYESGQATSEKVWRLPLWDDYKDELKSDIADLKNFHGKPVAGAIVAAKFLEVFTEKHPQWVHLDIAGTAFGDSEFSSMKSATAYGVRLLLHWLRK